MPHDTYNGDFILPEDYTQIRDTYRELSKLDWERLRAQTFNKWSFFGSALAGGTLTAVLISLGIRSNSFEKIAPWAAGIATIVGVAILMVRYLEGGSSSLASDMNQIRRRSIDLGLGVPFTTSGGSNREIRNLLRLRVEVRQLQRTVAELSAGTTQKNFDDLVSRLTEEVSGAAAGKLVEQVELRLKSLENNDLYSSRHAMRSFENTRERVAIAVKALSRRGAVNLTIGGLITLGGAAMLWYFVVQDTANVGSPIQYAMHFLPRLSIVVIVQVFALFFLRLYKLGLEEIKFFQNELTNIEQREIALSVSLLQDDPQLRSDVINQISKTERNNILEKGQSTIDIEKSRIESQGGINAALTNLIPMIVKAKSS